MCILLQGADEASQVAVLNQVMWLSHWLLLKETFVNSVILILKLY